MTWQKTIIVIFLFYFFALLQKSFFVHFNLLGVTPNLIFTLFFLFVFFSAQGGPASGWEVWFYAIFGGFFLDIFSYTFIGPSIVLLLIIGFLLKRAQLSLKNRGNSYPFVYFLPLFIIFLVVYDLGLGLYLRSIDLNIFSIIYNSFIASLLFYLCKRFTKSSTQA